MKKMSKTTRSNLITYLMVIVIFAVVQIMVSTGHVDRKSTRLNSSHMA